jgi:hypothetical protein
MIKFRYSHSWIFEYTYFLQFDFLLLSPSSQWSIDNVENLEVDLMEMMGSFLYWEVTMNVSQYIEYVV